MVEGTVVGEATLQPPQTDVGHHIVARRIHGYDLGQLENVTGNKDIFLVAIWKIKIAIGAEKTAYQYSFPGPDGCPQQLGDMSSSGIYLWDTNSLALKWALPRTDAFKEATTAFLDIWFTFFSFWSPLFV